MNNFSDFNIKPNKTVPIGDKIKINKIINREITVHGFKVEESKFKGQCLTLEIEFNNNRHIVFTGSTILIEVIRQIPQSGFPFKTTIIQENESFQFT